MSSREHVERLNWLLSGGKNFVSDDGDLEVDSSFNWEPVECCQGLGGTGVAVLTSNDARQSVLYSL